MFDWFKKSSPVVANTVTKTELPPKEDTKVFYRIGTTDNNRVAFQMGYSEITMNKEGIDNLIRQLAVFRDQLEDDKVEEQDQEQ